MSSSPSDTDIDVRNGYYAATRTFHGLLSPTLVPPPDLPLSFPAYALSCLLDSLPPSYLALVDVGTGEAVPFPAFLCRTHALAAALYARVRLAPGDVAFVLAPAGAHVPVLYYTPGGYLGEKDSTSEILDSEGWLRTGDVCCIDQDGFIYIVDRLKELIKYKGFQVPPAELENLLRTHPDIDEVALVP